jgi:hypothetical protein
MTKPSRDIGNTSRAKRGRFLALGLALSALTLGLPGEAPGATLRTNKQQVPPPDISGQEASDLRAFLRAGPKHWAVTHPPRLPAGIDVTKADGTLKTGALENFLFWTRAHNPTLFDKRHPNLAPLFQQLDRNLAGSQTLHLSAALVQSDGQWKLVFFQSPAASSSTGTTTGTNTNTSPAVLAQELTAPAANAVPEPASVVSTLALFGLAGGWWRLRRCRPHSRD